MGYIWAIPIVIVAVIALVIAMGTRRRRRPGAERASKENKPVVP